MGRKSAVPSARSDERRRVAARGEVDGDLAGVGVGLEGAEDGGAVAGVAAGVALVQHLVEGGQGGDGVGVVQGGGAQGVAGQRGDRGGPGALAAHIAEEEAAAFAVDGEDVVEVAAEPVRGGGVVVGGRLQPRYRRQGGGQQGLLEHGEGVLQPGAVGLRLFARFFGRLPAAQEFLFVGAAVAGVEDRGADQQRLAGRRRA